MRNFILAAVAVIALSFATSTAMADHFRHRGYYHRGGHVHHHVVPRYAVPHHNYHYAPVYRGGYYAYPQTYYGGYGYPVYSGGSVAISGRNLSLYIGF